MRFGVMEMLLIFGVLLLFFGASRLPTLGSSLGSAIKNFKKGFNTEEAPDEKKPDTLQGSRNLEGSAPAKTEAKDA
jgi:TatA/E family protein of Tat protein translocase